MADNLQFRFPDANKQHPFVKIELRLFGQSYNENKRAGTQINYVSLFTCLTTRSVHLEVCENLSTDCLFIANLRFVSTRVYPNCIVNGNGKNFNGAKQAMKLKIQRNYQPEYKYIRRNLAQQNIQWTINPPLAPFSGESGRDCYRPYRAVRSYHSQISRQFLQKRKHFWNPGLRLLWAAASQMADHLLLITFPFGDRTCVWNLLCTATSNSPLRTSSWLGHSLFNTGAGC